MRLGRTSSEPHATSISLNFVSYDGHGLCGLRNGVAEAVSMASVMHAEGREDAMAEHDCHQGKQKLLRESTASGERCRYYLTLIGYRIFLLFPVKRKKLSLASPRTVVGAP